MSAPSKDPVYELVSFKDAQHKKYAYHAHDYREVLGVLHSQAEGLSRPEVEKRRKEHGSNIFTEVKGPGFFAHIFTQLKSPLVFVLVLAFLLTFALHEYVDAIVICVALLVAVSVGMLQEGKSSQAFKKLAQSQVQHATVMREGKMQEILAAELVIGDIVILKSGVQVPADIRLINTKQLAVNEASLTGEWQAVKKDIKAVAVGTPLANQHSMAWMGTFISQGYATGVVVAIGDATVIGSLAKDVREVKDVRTPLQDEMVKISKVMLYLIIALVLCIFVIGLINGYSVHDMLLMSIAVAVASVPEGLPAAVTIILAVGMESLLKRGGLVRNLLAAETLGSTTFVLTDKTGTLTQAKMKIEEVLSGKDGLINLDAASETPYVRRVLDIALGAADAYTDATKVAAIHGDSVEVAVVKAASAIGISEFENSLRANRIDYFSFTSEKGFAVGLSRTSEGFTLCCNGIPSYLLTHATKILTKSGEETLTEEHKVEILKEIAMHTSAGKRLIAVAYKNVQYKTLPEDEEILLDELVFAGVLIMSDPLRVDIDKAIAGVQSAGAKVILITGDNPKTALSVAQSVGITSNDDDVVLTGSDLKQLTDEELFIAMEEIRVFARVLPDQKMRIVSVLQQKGEIVAMTGDGINDAPALRKANIGIAIGSGTEVAKEASDLVLVEDSFATIYAAIEEGRRIVSNLRKIVGYLLSTSLSEVVLIGTALLLGNAVPILPAQILWANVIEEGLMSVAFAFEKGDKNAMKRKPKDIHEEGILSKKMMWFMGLVVLIHGVLLVGLYLFLLSMNLPLEELRSVMFLAVATDSLFISFAFRSLTTPVWKIPLQNNLFFVGSFLLSTALLVGVLSVPILQRLLSYVPLTMYEIFLVVCFSITTLLVVEVAKWVFFENEE